MFKRISRIGSTPCKFQYALVLKELKLSLPLDGMEIRTIWTRGPHRATSITAESQGQGIYTWSFDAQKKVPMMLNCTLYRKEKPDGKGGQFQSKTCKITIKHVTDNGQKTRTIGEVNLDLAEHCAENSPPISKDFNLVKVEGTKNIEAWLSFTLHSRPLNSGKEAQTETMSQIEGMDKSVMDMDSTADFGEFGRKHNGLDSESDDDDDDDSDLDNPDDALGGFGTGKGGKTNTGNNNNSNKSAIAKNLSDSDTDSDSEQENNKNKKKVTSPTPVSNTNNNNSNNKKENDNNNNMAKLKEKYNDDNDVEVSRNNRVSSNRDVFAYTATQREKKEQQERMKALEKQMLLSEHKKEELEEQVMKLQNELKQQKQLNDSLQQELELHDRNTKEIVDSIVVDWSAKVGELQVENKSLKTRLQALEQEHTVELKHCAETIHTEYDKKMTIQQGELVQLKREVEQLRGRRIAFDEANDAIRANYSKGKVPEEIKNLQRQIKYFERQLIEADLTIDCVRSTYQSTNSLLMNEIKALEQLKMELRQSLSESQHANKELNSKNIVLETQCKKQQESKLKMSEILNQMEVLLSEKDERIGMLQNDFDELKLQNMRLQKELHQLRTNHGM